MKSRCMISEILLLATYPKKTLIQKDTHAPMFITALFTIAKIWVQPKCLSTDEWLKKTQSIYTVEQFSAIEKNEILPFIAMWIDLEGIMLSEGEGTGTPLQSSCLENPMDRGAWQAAAHEVAKSWTRLSNFTFTFHFHALEKEMATHSSVLAWRIPGTGEPGGLPSMGSHRVRHD